MFRSIAITAILICVPLTISAIAQTDTPVTAERVPANDDLETAVESLQERVERIERRLAARVNQEALGHDLVPLQPLVANLQHETLTRYIRLSLVLAIEDENRQAALKALSAVKPHIKDWLLSHLADKTVADLNGSKNQDKLRKEIQAGINAQLKTASHPEFVKAVLFSEFNVQ